MYDIDHTVLKKTTTYKHWVMIFRWFSDGLYLLNSRHIFQTLYVANQCWVLISRCWVCLAAAPRLTSAPTSATRPSPSSPNLRSVISTWSLSVKQVSRTELPRPDWLSHFTISELYRAVLSESGASASNTEKIQSSDWLKWLKWLCFDIFSHFLSDQISFQTLRQTGCRWVI